MLILTLSYQAYKDSLMLTYNLKSKIEPFQHLVYGHWLLGYFLPLLNYILKHDLKDCSVIIYDCGTLTNHIRNLPLWKERSIILLQEDFLTDYSNNHKIFTEKYGHDFITLESYEVMTRHESDQSRIYNNFPSIVKPAISYLLNCYSANNEKIDFLIVDRKITKTNNGKRIRLINNLKDLASGLKKIFDTVYLVDFTCISLAEQINYIQRSTYIFGQCGSALHNVIFCNPGSFCLEYDFEGRPQNKILSDYTGVHHILFKNEYSNFIDEHERSQIVTLDIPNFIQRIKNSTMLSPDQINTEKYRNFLKENCHKINLYLDDFLTEKELLTIWTLPRLSENDIHGRKSTIHRITVPQAKTFLENKLREKFIVLEKKDFIVEQLCLLDIAEPTKPHMDGHYPFYEKNKKTYCISKVCVIPIAFDTDLESTSTLTTKMLTFKQHYNHYVYGGLEFDLLFDLGKSYEDYEFEDEHNNIIPHHKKSFINNNESLYQHITWGHAGKLQYGLDIDKIHEMKQGSLASMNPNQIHCTEGYSNMNGKFVLRFCIGEPYG